MAPDAALFIEQGIPLPERRWKPKGCQHTFNYLEAFDSMKVGDSIFVGGMSTRAQAAAADWNRLHPESRLETRAVDQDPVHNTHGVRIWRTK